MRPTIATPPGSSRSPWRFAGAAYTLFVLIVGTNLASPLYPTYQQRFGFSALVIALIVAIYAAVLVPSLLVCGPLADTIGLRAVVVPALGVAALGAALFACAAGAGWLLAARAVQGLGVGAASGALTAALLQTEPRDDRTRAALLASTTTTGGAGAGPLLAGGLAQYAPAPRALCFLLELGLLALAVPAAAALPRRAPAAARRWRPRRPRVPPALRAAFLRAAAVSFLAWAVAYVILALVPSFVAERLHSDNLLLRGAAAGLLLLFAAAAQAAVADWAALRAQSIGLSLLTAGLAGLVVAGALASMPVLLVAVAVAGIGQGMAFMGALRHATAAAPAGEQASVAAAFWIVTYIGAGLPVIGVGIAATAVGLVTAVQLFAAVIAAACLVMVAVLQRPEPPSAEAAG
jgi:MFS family permease